MFGWELATNPVLISWAFGNSKLQLSSKIWRAIQKTVSRPDVPDKLSINAAIKAGHDQSTIYGLGAVSEYGEPIMWHEPTFAHEMQREFGFFYRWIWKVSDWIKTLKSKKQKRVHRSRTYELLDEAEAEATTVFERHFGEVLIPPPATRTPRGGSRNSANAVPNESFNESRQDATDSDSGQPITNPNGEVRQLDEIIAHREAAGSFADADPSPEVPVTTDAETPDSIEEPRNLPETQPLENGGLAVQPTESQSQPLAIELQTTTHSVDITLITSPRAPESTASTETPPPLDLSVLTELAPPNPPRISRARSLTIESDNAGQVEAVDFDELVRPRARQNAISHTITTTLSRSRSNSTPSIYDYPSHRVTRLSNFAADAFALHISTLTATAVMLPLEAVWLRRLALSFLGSGGSDFGDIRRVDEWFGGSGFTIGARLRYMSSLGLLLGVQGLVSTTAWSILVGVSKWIGRERFGWGNL